MISQPLLSIGIPTFNRPDGLQQIVLSITQQTYRNLEIIISDNCSTEPEVAQMGEVFSERDRRIQFYQQPKNYGSTNNFKYVFEKATGEYFLWISDDDQITDRDYLRKLMDEVVEGYDFVFPNVIKVDGTRKIKSENKKVNFESDVNAFQKHLQVIKKMYIGYQVVGGIYKINLLKSHSGFLFSSIYKKSYLDEEPFFHLMLSRFCWSYLDDTYYIKDMTDSVMNKMGFFDFLIPNFWNFIACAGAISEASYTNSEKVRLIFWKFLRALYVQSTMLGKKKGHFAH